MKKLFTLTAIFAMLFSASMVAQDFPSDPGELMVDLTLSALDNETGDSIPGQAPTGSGVYQAGTTLTITAKTIPGYTFVQWSDQVSDVSRQITLTESLALDALYSHEQYTIAFYNEGQLLSSQQYFWGDSVKAPEDPTKEGNDQYTFTFREWSPALTDIVSGSMDYNAVYDTIINRYAITFVDWDGEVLYRDTLPFGSTPEYKGETPTRETADCYKYTWTEATGWRPAIHTVGGEETYTAQYADEQLTFTVRTILGSAAPETQTVNCGDEISVAAPWTEDEHFVRWSDGSTDSLRTITVLSDTTLTAIYKASHIDINVAVGQWTFFCLPELTDGSSWNSNLLNTAELNSVKWGTYNGETRAEGRSGWENTTTYNALKGYIIWSSQAGRLRLGVFEEAVTQNALSISLVPYEAAYPENANWNFVGNPYNAVVTPQGISTSGLTEASAFVWDGTGYTNTMLEELTLQPLQAFFIQGSEESAIDFAGVESAPAPRRARAETAENSRIDIHATAGGYTDKTRVIFRSNSSLKYEAGRDASKFMTATAPIQMYFLDVDNVQCAQMVRPAGEDNIRLGYMLRQAGTINIEMPIYANDYELYDALTGRSYDLSEGISVESKAGTFNNRFELRPVKKVVTAIDNASAVSKTTKLIINGQLYLIRDGKTYTVQGLEAK